MVGEIDSSPQTPQGTVEIYSLGAGGVHGWKITKRSHEDQVESDSTEVTGFFSKANQGI